MSTLKGPTKATYIFKLLNTASQYIDFKLCAAAHIVSYRTSFSILLKLLQLSK